MRRNQISMTNWTVFPHSRMSAEQQIPDIFSPKVWQLVKIVLGIRSHKDDRPITSTILHMLTVSSALGKVKLDNFIKHMFTF